MTTCALCSSTDDRMQPDRRMRRGRAVWVVKGAKPVCSAHFPNLPDEAIEKLDPEVPGPVLEVYTEAQMRTLTGMFEDYQKLRRRLRTNYH